MTKKKIVKRKSVKKPANTSKSAKTVKKSIKRKKSPQAASENSGNISPEVPKKQAKRSSIKRPSKTPNKAMPVWGEKYLKAYEEYGTKYHAAKKANVNRGTANKWINSCPELRDRIEAIDDSWTDQLEQSALQRATHGSNDHIIYEGELVYHKDEDGNYLRDKDGNRIPVIKKKYETALTIFMLKARRRDTYLIDNMGSGGTADEKANSIRQALRSIEESIPQP